ncbi:hypothetical protein JCM3770_003504, partial [Rhodotorula araucariae]
QGFIINKDANGKATAAATTASSYKTPTRSFNKNQSSVKRECPICKKSGHAIEDCWQNPNNPNHRLELKDKKSSSGGGKSSGYTRAMASRVATASNHATSTGSSGGASWAAATIISAAQDGSLTNSWFLDTCATGHIAVHQSAFDSYTPVDDVVTTMAG